MTDTDIDRVTAKRLIRGGELVAAKALEAGVVIDNMGIARLFDNPRAYAGATNDWVLLPADLDPTLVTRLGIPRDQRNRLETVGCR